MFPHIPRPGRGLDDGSSRFVEDDYEDERVEFTRKKVRYIRHDDVSARTSMQVS